MKTAHLILRYVLAGIFLLASYDKILHPAEFASIVRDYKMIPEYTVNIVAILLPWLELMLGILLVLGRWLDGTFLLVNLLFFAFFGSLVLNKMRGIDVSCGCFSTAKESNANMAWYIIRDGSFVVLGLVSTFIYWKQQRKLKTNDPAKSE